MRKALTITIALVIMLLTVFSMDKNELSDTAAAIGISIDQLPDGQIRLCTEIADRSIGERSDNNDNGSGRTFSVRSDGIVSACRSVNDQLDKQLYWGGVMVMIFSADLDSTQIESMVRTVYSSDMFNDDLMLLQAADQAWEILNSTFGTGVYVSQGLQEKLDRDPYAVSISSFVSQTEQGRKVALPTVCINSEERVELL